MYMCKALHLKILENILYLYFSYLTFSFYCCAIKENKIKEI